MTLMKPHIPITNQVKDPLSIEYIGVVENNEDPDKLGQLQVRIDLFEELATTDLPWAKPTSAVFLGASADNIELNVPEVGTQVRVYFPTKEKHVVYYKAAELNQINKSTFFDEDYPNVYGRKDSVGNFTMVNKKTGVTKIQHSSTTNVEVVEDGTCTVSTPVGDSVKLSRDGSVEANINDYSVTVRDGSNSSLTHFGDSNLKAFYNTIDVLDTYLNCNVNVSGQLLAGNGWSGIAPTLDGRVMYVSSGIVVDLA